MSTDPIAPPVWCTTFFDDAYADIALVARTPEAKAALKRSVDTLVRRTGLTKGARVFDQCCGVGRLSHTFLARGYAVVGVDQNPNYIRRAQDAAPEGSTHTFVAGDATDFVSAERCELAVNFYTSFGYHRDDAVNARMLRSAFESLVPGGTFVLDYVNLPRVIADAQRALVFRADIEGETHLIFDEPRIDYAEGLFHSEWTVIHPDGRRETKTTEARAYMPHECVCMLRSVGFERLELYGDLDGDAFRSDAARCVIYAQRPEN